MFSLHIDQCLGSVNPRRNLKTCLRVRTPGMAGTRVRTPCMVGTRVRTPGMAQHSELYRGQ